MGHVFSCLAKICHLFISSYFFLEQYVIEKLYPLLNESRLKYILINVDVTWKTTFVCRNCLLFTKLPKTSWHHVISGSVTASLCNSSTRKQWKAGCPRRELSSTFSFMVSHISFFRESVSLCTLSLVWWINSTLLSCLNTIRIRTKVTRENQITKSYISNSKTICARWKQEMCVGFMFSLYPVISLLLLAHTRGESQYA